MFVSLIVSLVDLIFTQPTLNAAPPHSDWHQSPLRSLVLGCKDSFHWLTVWIFNSLDSSLFMIVGNKAEQNVTKCFRQTLWIKFAIFAAQRHNCNWCYMTGENRAKAVVNVSLLCLSHVQRQMHRWCLSSGCRKHKPATLWWCKSDRNMVEFHFKITESCGVTLCFSCISMTFHREKDRSFWQTNPWQSLENTQFGHKGVFLILRDSSEHLATTSFLLPHHEKDD